MYLQKDIGKKFPFRFIFLGFFVYFVYLCRPSEASTCYCAIPGDNPSKDWQSLPCAGRSRIWTQDYWFAVRCTTIEPPFFRTEPPLPQEFHMGCRGTKVATINIIIVGKAYSKRDYVHLYKSIARSDQNKFELLLISSPKIDALTFSNC
jgi:hypothetical protein